MAPDSDPRMTRAVQLLQERLHPAAIVLFGSRAGGRPRPDSDVDLGVLCGRPLPDAFTVAGLDTDLEDILGGSVDLVVLDAASPILAMAVLRSHRVLAMRDPEAVEDLDVEEIVVLNLQRAIQAVIDLAAHVISGRQWGLPDSLKAHFRILTDQRVIDPELGSRLQAMVGFRNIAVHEYDPLDRQILKAILANHLVDLEQFSRAITSLLAAGSDQEA